MLRIAIGNERTDSIVGGMRAITRDQSIFSPNSGPLFRFESVQTLGEELCRGWKRNEGGNIFA